MRTPRLSRRSLLLGGAGAAAAGALTGCGLGTAGGFVPGGTLAGSLARIPSLDGATIAVGSKNFTEQLLVGKIAVILFKAAGAKARDFTNIPGSSSTRAAMLNGSIQMNWEYTGTAWIAYLGHDDPIPDEHKQWQAVADEDLAKHGLVWLPPAPMNNTYGFAMTSANAKKLGITKLSQVASIPVGQRSFCVESEFNSRNDGLRPMLQKYGIPLGSGVPRGNIKLFDTGAIYAATAQGACTFGEVFTTDGRIKALDLVVLEDDRSFFPLYNLCPVLDKQTMADHPQIKDLFAPVAKKLTNETLMTLNAKIDVDGAAPVNVARDWLVEEGFLEAR